ncbi:MAG: A/G-specific adenine glycosylase [Marinagarivorans sp.]|nr:A/G-specific adenine glycosylase [Marinagarivorans sp.]
MTIPLREARQFQKRVLDWYACHGRKHLPWQQSISAYRVWLSEIMLQQTQVETVIPYFERFVSHYPSVQSLAAAPLDHVLHLWSGLGYYARARNLHKAAIAVCEHFDGEFPRSVAALQTLPGIGRSTAGAIASLAYQQPAAILDGNVKRVLARHYAINGWPGQTATANQLWDIAEALAPNNSKKPNDNRASLQNDNSAYSQVMMDLGAVVCTRSKPKCHECPLACSCQAYEQGTWANYPGKKLKKTLPVKHLYMLLLQVNNSTLLEERPSSGIWGGLWSLPELDDMAELTPLLKQRWPQYKTEGKAQPQATLRHTFSHYHLDITPVVQPLKVTAVQAPPTNYIGAKLEKRAELWYNPEQPQSIGLAAPVKKILAQLCRI